MKANSKFEPLSADAGSLEGRSPSFAVVDELHVHKTPEVYNVLNVASGARSQPLLFNITTSGVNREAICYQVRDYALKILQKHVDDDTFFSLVYGLMKVTIGVTQKYTKKLIPILESAYSPMT